ncbi:hypothetical protein MKW98_003859, partial [Papaver atlanticum]
EQKSGNRWLSVDREMIGYWPNELFTHLARDAPLVRYGGIAGAVSGSPSAPMGNGNLPSISFSIKQSGWMKEMKVYNESGFPVFFDFYKVHKKQDTTADCYNLNYEFSNHNKFNSIKYGGPVDLIVPRYI